MDTQKPKESLMTRRELAGRWRCHPDTIARREKEGKLHPVKVGHRRLYKVSEIDQIEA